LCRGELNACLRQEIELGQLGAYVVVGLGLPAASSAKNVPSDELGIRSGPLGVETRRCSSLAVFGSHLLLSAEVAMLKPPLLSNSAKLLTIELPP
jgi:hypothetical protein